MCLHYIAFVIQLLISKDKQTFATAYKIIFSFDQPYSFLRKSKMN